MSDEEKRPDTQRMSSDFNVAIYDANGGASVGYARAWWNIRRSMKPLIKTSIIIGDKRYHVALMPNRADCYPTAKIIHRELLRESAIRAAEAGDLDFLPEDREDKG